MIIDGKVYRNLEGQVEYLTEYLQSNAVAAELGIKVVGEAENVSDIPEGEYNYGDAYMIGTEAPYEMYIWTRASGNHPEDFWFNVGHFPMPGPQGETGLGVDDVVSETVDITNAIATQTGDLTQFALTTTITETLTDNSSITIPTTINIPIKSDGQISIIANEYEHHGRETIQIGLNEYLPNTYLQQRTPGSSRVANQPMIYGYKNQGIKINNLSPLPIQFEENNVIMFPATGDAADNNILSSVNSKWNTVLGKANSLSGGSGGNANTENLVFGGKNLLYDGVQDTATFGYRNEVYANQAMTHGYKNKNYGGESFVQGTENQLLGTITIDSDGSDGYDGASSDTKASAVIGNKNIIQHGLKHSLVVGNQQTVDTNCQQIIAIGNKNKIGKSCSWTNTFGDSNEIKNYATDSTVLGYQNKVYGGSNSSNPVQYVYMLGRNNDNRGPDSTANSNVFLIGEYLNATREQQVVVGCCNKGDNTETNAFFVVGTGDLGSPNTPKTSFMVEDGNVVVKGTLTVGSTSLSEAQLQSLLALI
jgi:hypothetical protein